MPDWGGRMAASAHPVLRRRGLLATRLPSRARRKVQSSIALAAIPMIGTEPCGIAMIGLLGHELTRHLYRPGTQTSGLTVNSVRRTLAGSEARGAPPLVVSQFIAEWAKRPPSIALRRGPQQFLQTASAPHV